ncbi:MAG: hypothetical protein AAF387_18495 [Pseudomonadota bacterium]
MKTSKFSLLCVVSLLTSVMLFVDGLFARRAVGMRDQLALQQQDVTLSFFQLWIPLALVQVVVFVLILRAGAASPRKHFILIGIFIFSVASLYSLTGYHQLNSATH